MLEKIDNWFFPAQKFWISKTRNHLKYSIQLHQIYILLKKKLLGRNIQPCWSFLQREVASGSWGIQSCHYRNWIVPTTWMSLEDENGVWLNPLLQLSETLSRGCSQATPQFLSMGTEIMATSQHMNLGNRWMSVALHCSPGGLLKVSCLQIGECIDSILARSGIARCLRFPKHPQIPCWVYNKQKGKCQALRPSRNSLDQPDPPKHWIIQLKKLQKLDHQGSQHL